MILDALCLAHSKQHLLDSDFEYLLFLIEEYATPCTMFHTGLKDMCENKQWQILAVQIMMDLTIIQSAEVEHHQGGSRGARQLAKVSPMRDG